MRSLSQSQNRSIGASDPQRKGGLLGVSWFTIRIWKYLAAGFVVLLFLFFLFQRNPSSLNDERQTVPERTIFQQKLRHNSVAAVKSYFDMGKSEINDQKDSHNNGLILGQSHSRMYYDRHEIVQSLDYEMGIIQKKLAQNIKVGLTALVTKSPNLNSWLHYYMNFLKLDLMVLGVENCAECKDIIRPYGDKIIASYVDQKNINITHNYRMMMDRQNQIVEKGLQIAKSQGIDYLIHSDVDELLYVAPDTTSIQLSRDILLRNRIHGAGKGYDYIHLSNFEAVYHTFNRNDEQKCFNTDKYLHCSKGGCLTYANGKSIAKVIGKGFYGKGSVHFYGPHHFSGKGYEMPTPDLVVLHFDSCTFEQWQHKFNLLKDTNDKELDKIPFKFYKESIRLMKQRDEKGNVVDLSSLEAYYTRKKVDPYYDKIRKAQVLNFMTDTEYNESL